MSDHVDACFWTPLSPGTDCPLTLETCNFYSDPGLLAPGPRQGWFQSQRSRAAASCAAAVFFILPELSHFCRLAKNHQLAFWLALINWYWNVVHCAGCGGCTDPDFATFINYLFAHLHIFIHAKFASLLEHISWFHLLSEREEECIEFKMLNSSKSMNLNP